MSKYTKPSSQKSVSIVLPVHNEHNNLQKLIPEILKQIPKDYSYEVIVVDDGSMDDSYKLIQNLASDNQDLKGISFYRNFGHQAALLAGLKAANNNAIITMDSDFQHPPELIPRMLTLWEVGFDLVAGQKADDSSSFVFRALRKIGYFFYKFLGDKTIHPGVSDFRLIDKSVRDQIILCEEFRIVLRGLSMLYARNPAFISYKVGKRLYGKPTYGFRMLINLFLSTSTSFSLVPLRVAGAVGLGLMFLSGAYLIYILVARFVFNAQVLQGWMALMFVVIGLFGFMFCYLGILAEYIGTIFEEIKARPKFVIKDKVNL